MAPRSLAAAGPLAFEFGGEASRVSAGNGQWRGVDDAAAFIGKGGRGGEEFGLGGAEESVKVVADEGVLYGLGIGHQAGDGG